MGSDETAEYTAECMAGLTRGPGEKNEQRAPTDNPFINRNLFRNTHHVNFDTGK